MIDDRAGAVADATTPSEEATADGPSQDEATEEPPAEVTTPVVSGASVAPNDGDVVEGAEGGNGDGEEVGEEVAAGEADGEAEGEGHVVGEGPTSDGLLSMSAENMSPDVLRLVGRDDEAAAAEQRLAEENAAREDGGWQPPAHSGLDNDGDGGDRHDDLDRGGDGDGGGEGLEDVADPHVGPEPTSSSVAGTGAGDDDPGRHYEDDGTTDSLVDDHDRFHEEHPTFHEEHPAFQEEHPHGVGFGVGVDDGVLIGDDGEFRGDDEDGGGNNIKTYQN